MMDQKLSLFLYWISLPSPSCQGLKYKKNKIILLICKLKKNQKLKCKNLHLLNYKKIKNTLFFYDVNFGP